MKKKNLAANLVADMARESARKNVNSVCSIFFYQPVVPEKAKKLRKF